MIQIIAQWKYWKIAAAGVIASVTTLLLLAFAGRWATYAWPGAEDGIQIAYFICAAAAAWIVTGIFIEAAFFKHRTKQASQAMDRLMELFADSMSDEEKEAADRG